MTFEEWKQAFSAEIQRKANLSKDVCDHCAHEARESYDDGMTPEDAVQEELYAMAGDHDPNDAEPTDG